MHLRFHRRQLLAALALAPAARAQFRVEIAGVGARQIPITVAAFRGENRAPSGFAGIAAIVRADLQRSGVFAPSEAPAAPGSLDERSTFNAAEWRARGTDAVAAGSMTRLTDGRWDVRFKLWDAVKGDDLLTRSRIVHEGDLRLAAHRIADDIHEKLTGEPGVNATRIAYVLKAGRRFTLNVTDADGQGAQVALSSNEPIISPAWSPDGNSLAYVSFETQKAVVWVQDLASGERRRVADFRGSNSAPGWSPDGRQLAVALSRDGLTQLFIIARDGSGPPRRLTTSSAIDTEPVYSPDGQQVYFVSDRGGGPQIYRVSSAGGSAERVSFSGSYNISPAISPDGKTLAYVARQGNAYRVVVQEIGSNTVSTLTETADDESPSFAPNGRQLLYATRVQGQDVLMTSTLDGTIKTRLLTSGADMREPAWGPYNRER